MSYSVANARQYTTSVLVTIVDGEFHNANSIVQRYGLKYQRQVINALNDVNKDPIR